MIESGSSELIRLLTEKIDHEVPNGWKTVEQMAKETGRGPSTIRKAVREGMEDGSVIGQKFMIVSGARRYPIWHYRIKTQPSAAKRTS